MKVFKNYVHVTNESGEVTRYEPGDECPEELVDSIDPNNLRDPVKEMEDEDEERRAKVNYKGMNTTQLQQVLQDRGLDTKGNKAELVKRLEAHDGAVS